MKDNKNEKVITPSQYFDTLKEAKKTITTKALHDSFDVFLKLAEKYKKLGQVESLKKLCFLAETLVKEEKLIEMGITTFVYKDVIEDYIENVADQTVKIIELSRYMREIPDELVDTIEKVNGLFDEMYVVFTDYTGEEERKVEKERRDKDPILFGVFKNNSNVADRFYFLGDWVDEYCDLTLDKMINEYKEKKNINPTVTTSIPKDAEELLSILNEYKENNKPEDSRYSITIDNETVALPTYQKTSGNPVKRFFKKVRSVFGKK